MKKAQPPVLPGMFDEPATRLRVPLRAGGDAMGEVPIVTWAGCYDESWKGVLVDEAFAHPAKASRGLLRRIFDELFAMGALTRGSLVLDPFAGIGTTLIEAASRGVQAIGCELEPRFHEIAQANLAKHAAAWSAMGYPHPIIVQGDSRCLREHVQPGLDSIVSSPPYISGGHHADQTGAWNTNGRGQGQGSDVAGYGQTEGQLGKMRDGQGLDAVISSPPYEAISAGAGGLNTKPPQHEGQQAGRAATSASQDTDQRYGDAEGQLARLPKGTVDTVVSSPPWGDNAEGSFGDTFWEASRDIVSECYALLRPGGVAVWILKDFVRDKQRVDFSGDWRKLCAYVGFQPILEAHAMLVHETRHRHLFDGERIVTRSRKSFFRRLAESKGSPAIDWETVIFMRKPGGSRL